MVRSLIGRSVEREDYRALRMEFLRTLVDVRAARGLEIGALDLPTVRPHEGDCAFADFRSHDELVRVFALPPEKVVPPTYVVVAARPLPEQIAQRFDYVVLCHVLEHVPDPIGFLGEVTELLRPGGVLLLAVPDKRRTCDASRPSTTLDHLLERHYLRAKDPPLAQIMEFSRAWSDELREIAERRPRVFYEFAAATLASGEADAHCNVWRDDELLAQLRTLIDAGFLPGLELAASVPNALPFNEFLVALRRDGAVPDAGQPGSSSKTYTPSSA